MFKDKQGKNTPIARIQASAQNSVAFTQKDYPYMWGSNKHGKMGLDKDRYNYIFEPFFAEWQILKEPNLPRTFEDEAEVGDLECK